MTAPKIRPNRRSTLQARVRALTKVPQARVATGTPKAAEGEPAEGAPPALVVAELWLYGVVGGYWWGFDAELVAEALRALPEDVDEIRVRVHSPGGSALEGIGIMNLLANHPAKITIVVDGLAASAASVLILGGDDIVVSPGAQVMIHDCSTISYGNAAQLRSDADWIDKQSANYSEVYAQRGGTAAEWREAMTVDNGRGTWYTAAEAVAAGLVDRVGTIQSITPPPAEPDGDGLDDDELEAAAAFDRDVLVGHADVWAAWSSTPGALPRAPKPPTASADGKTHTEGTAMSLSDAATKTLKAKLGVTAEDADEATILAALDEALAEQTNDEPTPTASTTTTVPEGFVLMDAAAAAALQAGAQAGLAARTEQLTEKRDRIIAGAISAGKFPKAREDHYLTAWTADPKGTEELIAGLAPGLVPVAELGHDQTPVEGDQPDADDLGGLASLVGLTAEDLR